MLARLYENVVYNRDFHVRDADSDFGFNYCCNCCCWYKKKKNKKNRNLRNTFIYNMVGRARTISQCVYVNFNINDKYNSLS